MYPNGLPQNSQDLIYHSGAGCSHLVSTTGLFGCRSNIVQNFRTLLVPFYFVPLLVLVLNITSLATAVRLYVFLVLVNSIKQKSEAINTMGISLSQEFQL